MVSCPGFPGPSEENSGSLAQNLFYSSLSIQFYSCLFRFIQVYSSPFKFTQGSGFGSIFIGLLVVVLLAYFVIKTDNTPSLFLVFSSVLKYSTVLDLRGHL